MADAWQNRIVGEGEEAPDQLLANPKNWRVHPKHQQAALEGVLDDVGWVQRVIVNRRTGHLIDGHLRVTLALRREEPTIPVLYVDLDEREEALVLATLDPIAALAASDREVLGALLADVKTGDAAVMELLASTAEAAGILEVLGDTGELLDSRGSAHYREPPRTGDVLCVLGDFECWVAKDVFGSWDERWTGHNQQEREDWLADAMRSSMPPA